MNYIEFLSGIFSSCWQAFSLQLPIIGLSGAQLLIGSFIAIVGISVLKSLLDFGLVYGGFRATMKSGFRTGQNIHKAYKAHHKQKASKGDNE